MTHKMIRPVSHKMSRPMTHGMTHKTWLCEVAMTLVNKPNIKCPQQKKTKQKETYREEENYNMYIVHKEKDEEKCNTTPLLVMKTLTSIRASGKVAVTIFWSFFLDPFFIFLLTYAFSFVNVYFRLNIWYIFLVHTVPKNIAPMFACYGKTHALLNDYIR